MFKCNASMSPSTLATWAAASALMVAWSPAQAFSTLSRDSTVLVDGFALNPVTDCEPIFGARMATATSSALSSAADLAVSGTGCYANDGFGRVYSGSYAAAQNVTIEPSLIQVQMAQTLDVNVDSEGSPAARVPSLSAQNLIDLELSMSGPTTLQFDVLYQGVTNNLTAWDFVRLEVFAQSQSGLFAGGVFGLNSSGAQSGVPFSTTVTFNANPDYRYFLSAQSGARANYDEYATGSLSFTVTAVPEPSVLTMMAGGLAVLGLFVRRQRNHLH